MKKNDFDSLNEQQKSAVIFTDGALRIIAGAGSGKTRVLTYKIAYLIENRNVSPGDILALTFSNKAANEMRDRAYGALEKTNEYPTVSTFHSLCARILRSEIHNFDYPNDFQILDESDQKQVLKIVYTELGISQAQYTFGSIISFIQNQKNNLVAPEDLLADEDSAKDPRTLIYKSYQERLNNAHSLDFDDLLVFVYRLFYDPKFEAISHKWSKRFKYLLIDEFQDTSELQYKIVKILAGSGNITVVGDPDQTIYSWRNADINIIMNFDKDFPEAVTIKLEQNYRSTKKILNAANNLISYNKFRLDKKLFTDNEEGEDIDFYCGFSEEAEARKIASKISELKRKRVQLKNIAILFRISSYSRAIEEALINENTIYKLFGSTKFYQREEVKDALAYLRVIHDGSEISLLRVINKPARRIGTSTIDKLLKFSKENNLDLFKCLDTKFNEIQKNLHIQMETLKNLASLINEIRWARRVIQGNQIYLTLKEFMINNIKYFEEYKSSEEEYENRMENFLNLIEAIHVWETKHPHGTIDEYLQEITLITDRDVEDDAASYVSLMTIHNAKGLEFDYVFVVGLSEDIFPLRRAITISPKFDFTYLPFEKEEELQKQPENIEGLEEERRLAYVAMTRARTKLFLSYAVNRRGLNKPSRFLKEAGIKKTSSIQTASSFSQAMDIDENVNLIVGDEISHSTYGHGKILNIIGKIIEVQFDDKKIRKLDKTHIAIKKL
ncbi:ATP-dependent DNA helicase UvrD/PcrA [Metamycoplasma arthritidis]|uniref:ATP-dependent helicase n=1 Tax=Metamycoplasma arthritidis TaxID=2111 RepID=UPI00100513E8|nr:ATP-dependent helicase [Metamycoplasma arthritidis]VEU79075.1 ATP-dependent DNA helicase UvrD/PcrA [Metamycoplasma arthritidis]